jgi:hypothetical protein
LNGCKILGGIGDEGFSGALTLGHVVERFVGVDQLLNGPSLQVSSWEPAESLGYPVRFTHFGFETPYRQFVALPSLQSCFPPYCGLTLMPILQCIRFPPGTSQGRGHACRVPGYFALKDFANEAA